MVLFPSFFFSCPPQFFAQHIFHAQLSACVPPVVLKTKTLQMQIHIASKIYSTWKLKSALHSEWNVFMANLLRAFFFLHRRGNGRRGFEIQNSLEEKRGKNCKTMHYNWILRKFFSAKCFRMKKKEILLHDVTWCRGQEESARARFKQLKFTQIFENYCKLFLCSPPASQRLIISWIFIWSHLRTSYRDGVVKFHPLNITIMKISFVFPLLRTASRVDFSLVLYFHDKVSRRGREN